MVVAVLHMEILPIVSVLMEPTVLSANNDGIIMTLATVQLVWNMDHSFQPMELITVFAPGEQLDTIVK